MKYTAVIPVKKNSSRLPGKNLLRLGDENLLIRKIWQLQKSQIADRVLVTSDSDEMLRIAKDMGVDAVKRPKDLADESRPLSEFFDYVTGLISPGHMIWTCVTSPFFDDKRMVEAKKSYIEALKNGYDSLITMYKFRHYLFDQDGPLNFNVGKDHQNSQELGDIDLFTNGILISPVLSVKLWHYNYGPNPYRFYVNQVESLDIDTPEDYVLAKAYLRAFDL